MDTVLATLADGGVNEYYSLTKLATVAVLFLAWVFACQWVDADAVQVKTKREQWNLIVISGGLAGLFVLFSVPWPGTLFLLGLAFFVLLAGAGLMAYVIHRNGRVVKNARVLTLSHAKRLMQRSEKGKKEKLDKGIRVLLADVEGKSIPKPDDAEGAEVFDDTQEFLFTMLWRRATEAELAVGAEKTRVVLVIDGVSNKAEELPVETARRVVGFMKQVAGLNSEERRRPQTGRLRAGLLAEVGDLGILEVTTSGSTAGERLRLRMRSPAQLKRLGELGLRKEAEEKLRGFVKATSGLVIFSGPRGSGITTTQYAIMREHDAFMLNLHTIERELLLELDNITQHPYKNDPDISYARQVLTVLRREPDILLVGECEDRETAQVACQAAAEDKKILLALEAGSCMDALGRFLALVENPALVGKALLGIVNERLLRVLCPTCRQAYRPDEKLLRKANLPVDKIDTFYRKPPEPILDKRGREIICQTCRGAGFVGRTGVFEILVVDEALRKLVAEGAPLKTIKAQARKARMRYLQEEGLLKVIDGTTSLNEVLRGLRVDNQ